LSGGKVKIATRACLEERRRRKAAAAVKRSEKTVYPDHPAVYTL